jgi:hypothetical protein
LAIFWQKRGQVNDKTGFLKPSFFSAGITFSMKSRNLRSPFNLHISGKTPRKD